MLTQYDEFPVHQSPYPFSNIPYSDLSWDDGYFFGVYNADAKLFLFTGMRVNPNTDMLGGYAGLILQGRQYTTRLSRRWRVEYDTHIGPLQFRFIQPFKEIRLVLEKNKSALSFDLRWEGLAPAYEEAHHLAWSGNRRTTDQTRYTQSGTASGWIEFDGQRFEVQLLQWFGSRDHSWGLYTPRSILNNPKEWLPPPERPAVRRSLRFWMPFQTPDYSGFYHFHEDENGNQLLMNDLFGTPFDGGVDYGWNRHIRFIAGDHRLEFLPNTRTMSRGVVHLKDEEGGQWVHELELACPAWTPLTIGYQGGSWKDGGSLHTYHGEETPVIEWDDFDFSIQPFDHQLYKGKKLKNVCGAEHLVRVRSTDPRGNVSQGLGQIELFIDGKYKPYGFQ